VEIIIINGVFMELDKKSQELLEKCREMADKPEVMGACQVMLETFEEKKKEIPEEPEQNYLEMAQNIAPADVPKILEMAMKVAKSGKVKDVEVKNAAERLIRAIG
jgi:vacuolar-type H+-ATPase subunit H